MRRLKTLFGFLMTTVIASGVFMAPSVGAQQRENVPPVLKQRAPPPLPDQTPHIRAFAKENKRAKRPRFVLFWNRDFSDEVVTYYIDYSARKSASSCQTNSASGCSNSYYSRRGSSASDSSSVKHSGTVRLNQAQARKNLEEILNWKLEGSFKNIFIKGGARLIDREMIIRTLNTEAKTNEQVNTYALETKAMIGKADYMVEILLAPNFDSESGLSFQVNVVGIATGETIASAYTEAMPPVRDIVSYDASNKGFEQRITQQGFSDQNVGRQLAINTMREITDYWRIMLDD